MKKLLLIIALSFVATSSLQAFGTLTGEQVNGMNKICFYSDGSAITVSSVSLCPLSR